MTGLWEKEFMVEWNDKAHTIFQLLKEAFKFAGALPNFNPAKASIVECYTSDFVTSDVLS